MASDSYGDAIADLETATECKGDPSEGYWMARAQVNALLAIASHLDSVDTQLRCIRDALEYKNK